ncbi:MAG: hypothetical protein CVU87_01165 [Firmicutes bacterium HGW-Firmicutes-12]|jgi:hypothetical protein|nr:MAG: hypothetical protein CVU87_01165 [Firmicutes bacterium HGW-Firmicutes-12]
MASEVQKLVWYTGLADELPLFNQPLDTFKQFIVQKNLVLPADKPNIEQIIQVDSRVIITSKRFIQTPIATSLEEQRLTGWKLVVEGQIKLKVKYVADIATQNVHGAHFNVPFSIFIVLPPDFEEETLVDVESYVEAIYAQPLGKRKIFYNASMLLLSINR